MSQDRHPKFERVNRDTTRFSARVPPRAADDGSERRSIDHPSGAQETAEPHQRLGWCGQTVALCLKERSKLWKHEDHDDDHCQHCHNEHDGRVHHRALNLFTGSTRLGEVLGDACQHFVQLSRCFGGAHQ